MKRLGICACLIAAFAAGPTFAGVQLLTDVPAYTWYHGCGPTAAGMIIGYWDSHGFPNLIPGTNDWNTNRQAIQNMIASPGHIADYALYNGVDDYSAASVYPDLSSINPSAAHPDDCLADYMRCSFSADGLRHGWSNAFSQGGAMDAYALQMGYDGAVSANIYGLDTLWSSLKLNIKKYHRPMELYVDSDGIDGADHMVTAIGYDDTPGALMYACYNTWDTSVHWYAFAQTGQWAVYAATEFYMMPEPTLLMPICLAILLLKSRRRD